MKALFTSTITPRSSWRSHRSRKGWTLVGLAAVFLVDMITPLGFADGTLYPLVVLLAGGSHRKRWVIATAVIALMLTGVGFWLSPVHTAAPATPYVIANRLVSAVAIVMTGGLMLALLRRLDQMQVAQTKLDAADQKTRSQQHLLRMASDVGHLGGWQVHLPDYRVVWSETVAQIHGLDPGYSPTWAEAIQFYAPEYCDRITEVFQACVEAGTPFDEELQIITATGQRVWVRSIGQPVRDAAGRIGLIQGAFQDINAQKQAAASLELSQQRFRQLAEAMPLIVWTAAPDGTVDYANHQLRSYTGILAPAPHPIHNWLDLLHPEDQAPCITAWTAALDTGSPYRFEFRLRRYDGAYNWHLIQAVPIRNEQGQIIRWYGTATDIHLQKQLERETRQLATRLNNTLESITDAFMTLDHQWRLTFLNRRAEELLQQNRDEVLGQCIWDVFPDALGTAFQHQYETAVADQQSVSFREYYPPLQGWFNVRAYPSPDGLSIYFQEITERLRLEEQLLQIQRLESIGKLTGGVAHDFNNLLTVILGNAEELTAALATDADLHSQAQMIESAAQRGADLTQHLLAFARRQPLDPKVIDINQLIANMNHLLSSALSEDITVEWQPASGLWPALVDPIQIETALLNLCFNARDAMPQGGRITLTTANVRLPQTGHDPSTVAPGEYVMVAVSDTGAGIAPEHFEHVFEPFFTTKPRGQSNGLGLSMVYGFIKQSGGHITLNSQPWQGTTARLYLPRSLNATASKQSGNASLKTSQFRGHSF